MKLRIQSIKMACFALFCALFASCDDDALVEASQKYMGKFELTVTQANPESRLELGQDGLTTQWEPGDKLVLVDKTRTLAPIFLNCTLKEKSNTATFIAENGVPAGDYYVIYNYNENLAYGHKGFQSVDNINMNDDLVLWNELKIQEGDDNASISLQHLYAKVRVELKNMPNSEMNDGMGKGFTIGVYSSKKGFPAYKQFTSIGLVDAEYGYNPNSMSYMNNYTYFPSNRKYHNIRFGSYDPTYIWDESTHTSSYDYSKAAELSALVLPADLSQEAIFFYAISGNTCYELKKEGVNLKAGTSYKVILDMSQATVSTLNYGDNTGMASAAYQVNNAADWRHAVYKNSSWDVYELTKDIDFEGEDFFPIAAREIKGKGYVLSNIELDWADEDNVGLIRHEWEGIDERRELRCVQLINQTSFVSDLKLENVTFKGNNFVGAFGGWNIAASKCEVIGNSIVEGQGNHVGGIVGFNKLYYSNGMNTDMKFDDVRVGQKCSVSGKNYVGGIVGRYATENDYMTSFNSSMILMESCKSEATVTATEDYVGGIFGRIGGNYRSNYSSQTNIEFSMEDYTFSLIKCMNEGTVIGRHYVGGIGGEFAVYSSSGGSNLDRVVLSQSYSNGDVTGDTKVGGILGSSMAATNICYSIGTITANTSIAGGIIGEMTGGWASRVANSYSLATLSADDNTKTGGIVGNAGMSTVTNCYYAADPDTYSFGGIVGYSGGGVTISNCLTTLNSLGTNLGDHIDHGNKRDWMDTNNDGIADYDYDNNGVIDNNDLYEWYYNYKDNVTNSISAVKSILANKNIINGDNAYSSNIWPIATYPWECVKFASFSADTNSPDYDEETIN